MKQIDDYRKQIVDALAEGLLSENDFDSIERDLQHLEHTGYECKGCGDVRILTTDDIEDINGVETIFCPFCGVAAYLTK